MKNGKGKLIINEFRTIRDIFKIEVWSKAKDEKTWKLVWQGIGSPLVGSPKPPGEIFDWGYKWVRRKETVEEIPHLRQSERKTSPCLRYLCDAAIKR